MPIPSSIEITGIYKSFGSKRKKSRILKDLHISVRPGEVFGFLGPNGAGKSTTIKLLLGFLQADSGTMCINGKIIGKEEYRHHIGYLPELPFFYDHLTAMETLLLSGMLSGVRKQEAYMRAESLLTSMDLMHAARQSVGGFSKGMKQRLGMAGALIHDPEILILDEPMSGLDPMGRYQIKKLIIDLKSQGKTLFFSSHILSDIEELCDRISIIHKGVLLYTGKLEDFVQDGNTLEEQFIKTISENINVPIA